MSGENWKDLEAAWQALAPPEPVLKELRSGQRWRWASRAYLAGELLATFAGVGVGLWILSSGDTGSLLYGSLICIFTLVCMGVSLWARQVDLPNYSDGVVQATAMAVRRARIGVRLAIATFCSVGAAALYLAILAFMAEAGLIRLSFLAVGLALLWVAAWLTGSLIFYRRRSSELWRLEQIEKSFNAEL